MLDRRGVLPAGTAAAATSALGNAPVRIAQAQQKPGAPSVTLSQLQHCY
jgi:hypothetical protein